MSWNFFPKLLYLFLPPTQLVKINVGFLLLGQLLVSFIPMSCDKFCFLIRRLAPKTILTIRMLCVSKLKAIFTFLSYVGRFLNENSSTI